MGDRDTRCWNAEAVFLCCLNWSQTTQQVLRSKHNDCNEPGWGTHRKMLIVRKTTVNLEDNYSEHLTFV